MSQDNFFDLETEMNVLAGMLKSPKMLAEGLSVCTKDHFENGDHQTIFTKIESLSKNGMPSFAAVAKELRNKVDYDQLLNIKDLVVSEDSFDYWLKKLDDLFIRWSYFEAAREIATLAKSDKPTGKIKEIIEQRIMRAAVREGREKIVTPQEAAASARESFMNRVQSEDKMQGIKLTRKVEIDGKTYTEGFPGLDELMMGLAGGDLIVIAAETGEGKTALALNIVRHASIHQNYRTFYQNTEMKESELVNRMAAQLSKKEFKKIHTGDFEQGSDDEKTVLWAFDKYEQGQVYMSTLPLLTPERSAGLAREFKIKYGHIDLLVIDYIGRMELQTNKYKQEWQVLRDIAKNGKRLAQELNACVILISQLTGDKLQGSTQIENECDGVFYLKPLKKAERENAPAAATHSLFGKKVRRGAKGTTLWIGFNKKLMYISEIIPIKE